MIEFLTRIPVVKNTPTLVAARPSIPKGLRCAKNFARPPRLQLDEDANAEHRAK
jgi:hypothetical protein